MSNFKQHEFYIWVIGLLLFYGYLGLIIPLHGIDWFFGSHQGISTFYHHFDNLNGRYISNLIELCSSAFGNITYDYVFNNISKHYFINTQIDTPNIFNPSSHACNYVIAYYT